MLSEHHRAVQREAQLAAEQIGYGVSILGKATHAETGRYTQAFFGLSIGMERMGKLIYVADHAITHGGVFPTDKDLRDIGHDITSLLNKCEEIAMRLDPDRRFPDRPRDPIHLGIEECLSLFAKTLRYYNLNHLVGSSTGQKDPIALWWEKVATPICDRHYSQKQRERDEANGEFMDLVMGEHSLVLHTAEDGQPITDLKTFFGRGIATRIVQKYGRMYTLQIVRWMTSVIMDLEHEGAYKHRIDALLGLYEPFTMFFNENRHLRDWKRWTNYRS